MKKESTSNPQEETVLESEKKTKRYYFWAFFFVYLIFFVLFWYKSISEFGLFYIVGVGCFVSFFLAWASSLFLLLFKMR